MSPTIEGQNRLLGQFIQGWIQLLEYWDPQVVEHSRRVARLSVLLAQKCGWHGDELAALEWGALLHDLGKVCIPASILLRTGSLTDQEWVTVKCHPIFGYEILHKIEALDQTAGIVLCHHENWDGSGYPHGILGEKIPSGARIVAVVEVWDALTSNPADQALWPKDRVTSYIREHAGRRFDPVVAETFLEITGAL